MSRSVAVVGGGVSGLAAAEALKSQADQQGLNLGLRVFEAEAVAGGKVRSERHGDFVIELGPHGYLDKEPTMRALVSRLGLDDQQIEADAAAAHRFIVQQGKLRELPTKPPAFLKSDVLPLGAKLRLLYEPFVGRASVPEESVADFFCRRLGPRIAEGLVDAMVTGIYAGDPKRLSMQAAFPKIAALEAKHGSLLLGAIKERRGSQKQLPASSGLKLSMCSFTQGLGALTDALIEQVPVATNKAAKGLKRAGSGYRLTFDDGSFEADAVVLAVPAAAAQRLLGPLNSQAADSLGEVVYSPVSVVCLGFSQAQVQHSTRGFGFLAPHPEGRDLLGCIWATSVFPAHGPEGSVMFRVLVGGRRRPELAALPDAELLATVRRELGALMGLGEDVEPMVTRIVRWPAGIPQYEMQHHLRVEAADALQKEFPGVFIVGNGFRGVALLDCVKTAHELAPAVLRHLEASG